MIEKFVNNDLSESDTDEMMSNYFNNKEEKEFKKRWHKIIDEDLEQHGEMKRPFSSKRLYIFSSVAALFILVIVNFYIFSNDYQYKLGYSVFGKGKMKTIKKLDSISEKTFKMFEDSFKKNATGDYKLFIEGKYIKIYRTNDKKLNSNTKLNNETKMITALAEIKKIKYKDAELYLKKIDKNSPLYINVPIMLKLTDKILNDD